ncbi:hypothetical protein ACTJKK_12835 [Microbacterium sp. 22179]|uniref:hypothetical protein n=1 Tax=Microbacterium sp. 22179 TaxID=3453886 RepID=UPI003F878157|nr:hypothetical protein [Microbacterium sp.]
MIELLQILGAVFALIGGFLLFRALITPRRFRAKRPWLFTAGWGTMAIAALFFSLAGGWIPELFVPAEGMTPPVTP